MILSVARWLSINGPDKIVCGKLGRGVALLLWQTWCGLMLDTQFSRLQSTGDNTRAHNWQTDRFKITLNNDELL